MYAGTFSSRPGSSRAGRGLLSLLTGAALLAGLAGNGGLVPTPAAADAFASVAFTHVWERTDKPVADGKAPRSWLWGNQPFVAKQEPYAQGLGGTRLVQYFDKSRMEINDPNGDQNSPWFVTNGLLVVEMMTGKIQTGNNEFQQSYPANVAVAGDTNDPSQPAPTYATFGRVATLNGDNGDTALPVGLAIRNAIDKQGNVTTNSQDTPQDLAHYAAFSPQTQHNIADVFWTFLNSQGLVYAGGQYQTGPLMNWVFVMGYPLTEPYWTTIRVGGIDRQVLIQAFQRRVLTYSPNNPPGWQVEMGNVGRHYYSWRYEHQMNCNSVPVRGFGTVWANNPDLAAALGCPADWSGGEQPVATTVEHFEHGTMLAVAATNSYPYGQDSIFAFFDDGTYQHFDNTYVAGQPNACTVPTPSGLYLPQHGFNKVWCEGTGARVRERLGFATDMEKAGAGAWQRFEHGLMYWTGASLEIFALTGTDLYEPADHRWQGFHDTFQNP
ncbi:MAG TPA: hypothetical protein VKY74_26155 [Chloroflexia bacterium]|nr:hypothetical protein [Chloroflexia bacterium]